MIMPGLRDYITVDLILFARKPNAVRLAILRYKENSQK